MPETHTYPTVHATKIIQLLIEHFKNSVPESFLLPVPATLNGIVDTILFLRNPGYPRHFLNGVYIFLKEGSRFRLELIDMESPDLCLSLWRLISQHIQCREDRWRLLDTWQSAPWSRIQKLTFRWRVLGWPSQPSFAGTDGSSASPETVLVMSLQPTRFSRILAGLRCYATQLASHSRIIDGSDYFCSRYPAKSAVSEHEDTLAWICRDPASPVGYIQYTALENDDGEREALITGLAVEEPFRRRGFGQALIFSVISRMSRCREVWISVSEGNEPALRLYLKCGFEVRRKLWETVVTSRLDEWRWD